MRRGPRPGRGLPVGAAPRVAPGRRRRPPSSPARAGPTCSCRPTSSVRGSARGHSVHRAVTVPPDHGAVTDGGGLAVTVHEYAVRLTPPRAPARPRHSAGADATRRQAVAASPEVVPHETDRPASRHLGTASSCVPVENCSARRAGSGTVEMEPDVQGDRRDRAAVGEEVAETLRFSAGPPAGVAQGRAPASGHPSRPGGRAGGTSRPRPLCRDDGIRTATTRRGSSGDALASERRRGPRLEGQDRAGGCVGDGEAEEAPPPGGPEGAPRALGRPSRRRRRTRCHLRCAPSSTARGCWRSTRPWRWRTQRSAVAR